MLDEGTLRERFPEIPWDQPVQLTIPGRFDGWACRYCVGLVGVKGALVITGLQVGVFDTRDQALDHIEAVRNYLWSANANSVAATATATSRKVVGD